MPKVVATQSETVHCRICGHEDSLTFCSSCGLPLDYRPRSTAAGYVIDRIKVISEPAVQFIVTFLLLLIRPRAFFQRLEDKGSAVDGSLLWLSTRSPVVFKPYRRPMTPVGYLFVVTVLAAVLSDHYKLTQSVINEAIGYAGFSFSTDDLPAQFPEVVAGVVIELLLIILLFMLISFYRWALGITKKHFRFFVEFFLYMSAQFIVFVFVVVILADQIWGDEFWQANNPIYCFAILSIFSVFCFLLVPLYVFPELCSVSRWRVIVSFFIMYFFILNIAPIYYVVYFVGQMVWLVGRLASAASER